MDLPAGFQTIPAPSTSPDRESSKGRVTLGFSSGLRGLRRECEMSAIGRGGSANATRGALSISPRPRAAGGGQGDSLIVRYASLQYHFDTAICSIMILCCPCGDLIRPCKPFIFNELSALLGKVARELLNQQRHAATGGGNHEGMGIGRERELGKQNGGVADAFGAAGGRAGLAG